MQKTQNNFPPVIHEDKVTVFKGKFLMDCLSYLKTFVNSLKPLFSSHFKEEAKLFLEKNIEFDGNKYWICFTQQKTKESQRIPMLDKAKRIYDKYEFERMVSGYVLPRLSNQKVNAYLKTIANLAGIQKPLTHHVARHTSATTIFLANGVSLEVVSKQLGHSSIKTTEVYAKITNSMLANAADELDEILK